MKEWGLNTVNIKKKGSKLPYTKKSPTFAQKNDMIDSMIWAEVHRLKYTERYVDLYLDVLKCRRKWIHILSLVFASGGLLGSVQWDMAPLIGIAITAAIQIFSILQEHVIMPNADLAKVMDVRILCVQSCNKFEKLFLKFRCKLLTEEDAINEFYHIRSEFYDIQKLFNVLHLPQRKKTSNIAAKDANQYLTNFFNLSASEVAGAAKVEATARSAVEAVQAQGE